MSRKLVLILLIFASINLHISYEFEIKDILDESRKQFFFTQKEYKGMLEREAKEEVIKISNMHNFRNNNTPTNYFKYYLNDLERKKSINNSIRLLCNSSNSITQFDYFNLIEQTVKIEDKEIIKATMYRFRELYLIWLSSKALETIFSKENVKVSKMCEYMNNPQPNQFFSDNDISAEFINIRDLEDSDFYQNIDVLEEERNTSAYGFRLEIKVKDLNLHEGSNELLNSLINDSNFSFDSLIQIDFINAHSNFNTYFSSLDYIIKVNIKGLGSSSSSNNKENNIINMKTLYSEMKLGHLLLSTMEKLSFSQLNNLFSAMFKVSFNLDSIFNSFSLVSNKPNNEKNTIGLGLFSKNKLKNEKDNSTRRIFLFDLALSFPDLFNIGSSNLISTLEKSVERAIKLYLGLDVISEMKKDKDIQRYININNDSYKLEKENMSCEDKILPRELSFSSLHESDILNINQSTFKLCNYRKAIEILKDKIQINQNDGVYISFNELFTKDYEFAKYIILSSYSTNNKYFNTIEKMLPTYYHNNFYDKKGCVELSNEETLLLFTSLTYKIAKYTSQYYSVFEVYTSNYNEHLDNAKLYLSFYLISISKEIRTINFYLNKCKNKSQTILDNAFDRHENNNQHKDLLKEKLLMLEDRMNNFYNLMNLIDNTFGYYKVEFLEQITKVRSFFYQFVYKNDVLLGNEINYLTYKNIFTDFNKNRDYSIFIEDILTSIIRLVVDKTSFDEKSLKYLTLKKYFQEEIKTEEKPIETVNLNIDSLNNKQNVKKEVKDGKLLESFEINLNDIMKNEDI